MEKVSLARIMDLDDTSVKRETSTRIASTIASVLTLAFIPHLSLRQIERMSFNHEPVNVPVRNKREQDSLDRHARREFFPSAIAEIQGCATSGIPVYIATGRSNKQEWVVMTEASLKNAGVRQWVSGIYYTPDGIPTATSKAHVMHLLSQQYETLEFDDDDPRTVAVLARLFPDMTINYVAHGLARLLGVHNRLEAQFSNVRAVKR